MKQILIFCVICKAVCTIHYDLILQLAALSKTHNIGDFPDLRWAQTVNLGFAPNSVLKNVFMAVAMDLPDYNSPWGA